jgi:hypothetical protein
MALNIHVVIHQGKEDIEKAAQTFINQVAKLGHDVVSTVITDDNGQIHLTPEAEDVVHEVEQAVEKDVAPILHSTLDAL